MWVRCGDGFGLVAFGFWLCGCLGWAVGFLSVRFGVRAVWFRFGIECGWGVC